MWPKWSSSVNVYIMFNKGLLSKYKLTAYLEKKTIKLSSLIIFPVTYMLARVMAGRGFIFVLFILLRNFNERNGLIQKFRKEGINLSIKVKIL